MGLGTKATVTGLKGLMQGIGDAFDRKQVAAEMVAVEMANKALTEFRGRQMSQPHVPFEGAWAAKADTKAKKQKAIAFAERNQGGPPVTTMRDPWINRSFRAARSVYADAAANSEEGVYFSLYHTMSYGVYLELANNRRHAVLEPIVRGLSAEFLARVKGIYGPS